MRVPVPDVLLPAEELGRVHFVGIGGAGLSGIARIMLRRGVTVSGSDQASTPVLEALRGLGARVHVGHAAGHVHDVDTVVVSTAVREDNPELLAALDQGLRVLPRSAALASVMAGRRTVAVAGTHGKTTTTSLLTVALQAAGADPTYAIGGELTATGVNADEGSGPLFVAEADESDGAFLVYSPHTAVVTTLDADHLDQWGTEEAYRGAFAQFVERVSDVLVVWDDSPETRALAELGRRLGLAVVTYGESPDADLRLTSLAVTGGASTAVVSGAVGGTPVSGVLRLRIPGRHYLLDAAAALAAGVALGHPVEPLLAGLASFGGTRRRMERLGAAGGVQVYDSYAHHPSEIAGDLAAARAVAGAGRLVVAFQPHLVSRTRIFGAAMGQALGAADEVVVAGLYLAREDPDPAVTSDLVAAAVPLPPDRVEVAPDLDDVVGALLRRARPGDLVLTLGAGDVTTVGPRVLVGLGGGSGEDGPR